MASSAYKQKGKEIVENELLKNGKTIRLLSVFLGLNLEEM